MIGKITNWFDNEGDEIETSTEAVAAVISWPDGLWSAINLVEMEEVTIH